MALPSSPNTRKEVYLSNIAGQGTSLPTEPHTREEEYLDYIAKNGGGGGGTGDGDMKKAIYDDDLSVAGAGGIADYVASVISGKVDKVVGKGLSTNDYDNTAKGIVDGVNTALDGKVSKSNTAGLLKNDGTVDQTSYATAASVSAIKDGTTIDSFGDVETALSDKADKVSGATNGNLAGLDSNGNLTDSGKSASNVVMKSSTAGLLKNDGTVDTQAKMPYYDLDKNIGFIYDAETGDTSLYTETTNTIASGSEDIPTSGAVYNVTNDKATKSNVIANTKLTKDTVGWINKNKAKFTGTSGSSRGIDFTLYPSEGRVHVNGTNDGTGASTKPMTSAGNYYHFEKDEEIIISGGTNAVRLNLYNISATSQEVVVGENPVKWTIPTTGNYNFQAYIIKNTVVDNVDIYPMITSADVLDQSFVPYHESVDTVKADKDDVIANTQLLEDSLGWVNVNLINDNIYTHASSNDVTKNGHAFSVSTNNNVDQYSSMGFFVDGNNTLFPAGKYVLKLTVTTVTNNTAGCKLRRANGNILPSSPSAALAVGVNKYRVDVSEPFYVSILLRYNNTSSSTVEFSDIMLYKDDYDVPVGDDYYPYSNTTAVSHEEYAVTGAYNVAKNNMVNHSGESVTFTVNDDKTISLSGTSSGNIANNVANGQICDDISYLPNGRYKLVGCPSGGSSSTYRLTIANAADTEYISDLGDGLIFDITDSTSWKYLYIRANSGVNLTGKVYKPMITTDLNATYDDYVAPTMTNKELTDKVTPTNITVTPSTDIELRPANRAKLVGNIMCLNLVIKNTGASAKTSSDTLVTISGIKVPHSNNLVCLGAMTGDGTPKAFLFTHDSSANTIVVKILNGNFAPDETYAINFVEVL